MQTEYDYNLDENNRPDNPWVERLFLVIICLALAAGIWAWVN